MIFLANLYNNILTGSWKGVFVVIGLSGFGFFSSNSLPVSVSSAQVQFCHKRITRLNIIQGRHNLSKTEGAAQKLGGQNIENYLTFDNFGLKFQEK